MADESTSLPSELEINPFPGDLDGQWAVRNFLGKTRAQITEEFEEYGYCYQEDFLFMGSRAFCFYFPAAVDYVIAHGDSEVANALCSAVEIRLKYEPTKILEAFPTIVRFADHVLTHYGDFDPDDFFTRWIYGSDFRSRLQAIKQRCATHVHP